MSGIRHMATRLGRIFLLLIFLFPSANCFPEDEGNEYNIKAMFVLNFMKYVEWPDKSHSGAFNIGVAGESGIFNALVAMTTQRQENGHIRIEKVAHDSKSDYQILIIPREEVKRLDEWTKKYQGKGVLVITEECGIDNSAINLLTINNKIRFEINYIQAKRQGVKISSRLADMAISVQQ